VGHTLLLSPAINFEPINQLGWLTCPPPVLHSAPVVSPTRQILASMPEQY
jgi:hypothetical protein